MSDQARAVLFFDTSSTSAGVLLAAGRPEAGVLAVERFTFETEEGDAVIGRLFRAAVAWRGAHPGGALLVGCEDIRVSQGNPAAFAIQQAITRRKGQLQLLARQHDLRWGGEVSPVTGKLALTGRGNAGKERMVMFANQRFRGDLLRLLGKPLVFTGHSRTCGEHVADALGGGLAALAGRWQETPAEKRARKRAEQARLKAAGLPVPKKAEKKRTNVMEEHLRDYRRREQARIAATVRQGELGI